MIKVLSMMKRKEGMSLDDFRRWLTEEHVKLARQIPGLEKFVVNIPVADSKDNPFDSVNELYFKMRRRCKRLSLPKPASLPVSTPLHIFPAAHG
jgi:hypothetical protein